MARILYGIMGDARGHLSRSLSVVQHMQGHEFLFAGGGTVLELRDHDYEVYELPMLSTLYKDTRVDFVGTGANALRVLCGRAGIVNGLIKVIERFKPDLIISDYEFFVPLAARRMGLPCLSLDHQHVLTHCAYVPPPSQQLNRMLTCIPIMRLYSNATKYMVSSFYELPPKNQLSTEVVPPILRKDVRDFAPLSGDHVLVYSSAGAYKVLLPYLEKLHRPCHIYGYGDITNRGNLVFKPRSVHGFLQDLSTCCYVISNGGHNCISEALYYGKPVMCLPIHFLYEQFMNGHFLKDFGFGEYSMEVKKIDSKLRHIDNNIENYTRQIVKFNFWGNDQVVDRLQQMCE